MTPENCPVGGSATGTSRGKITGQSTACSDPPRFVAAQGSALELRPPPCQQCQRLRGGIKKPYTARRERQRLLALDQRRADSLFQCPDAPAERRVGAATILGSTGQIAGACQLD